MPYDCNTALIQNSISGVWNIKWDRQTDELIRETDPVWQLLHITQVIMIRGRAESTAPQFMFFCITLCVVYFVGLTVMWFSYICYNKKNKYPI